MLNPRPSNLKVYYQNVRGLILFSDLDNPQPRLDMTKIYEINTYVHKHKPENAFTMKFSVKIQCFTYFLFV